MSLSVIIPNKKEARKEYLKKYREKNHERILTYRRSWYKKNNEKLRKQVSDYYIKNSDRVKKYQQVHYTKHKGKVLDRVRLRRYGITGEEFRNLIEKQQGKCPICKKELDKNPSVDHSHVTGKIRGFICNKCNLAIGNAEDSAEILRAMATYLEERI